MPTGTRLTQSKVGEEDPMDKLTATAGVVVGAGTLGTGMAGLDPELVQLSGGAAICAWVVITGVRELSSWAHKRLEVRRDLHLDQARTDRLVRRMSILEERQAAAMRSVHVDSDAWNSIALAQSMVAEIRDDLPKETGHVSPR